jgi:hypothetical protein
MTMVEGSVKLVRLPVIYPFFRILLLTSWWGRCGNAGGCRVGTPSYSVSSAGPTLITFVASFDAHLYLPNSP